MRSLLLIASTSIALCMGAAAAQAQEPTAACISDPETIAALEAADDARQGVDTLGRSAAVCGHAWSAANLLEKANAQAPTVINQFNLAAAYVTTGRLEAGLALYQQAAERGRFTNIILDAAYANPSQRALSVNVTDEANRRIARLNQRIAARAPVTEPFTAGQAAVDAAERAAPFTAGQAGVDAAERADVPVVVAATATRLTDAEALARDGLR